MTPILARLVAAVIWLVAWQMPATAADIQQVRSPGGISAWLVEEKSLPIIAIRFAFDGGGAQEPAGKEGASGLLAALLDQGAGNLSGTAYQKQMERLAARISFDSDRDAFFGNFETLTANLAKSVELLKLAVTVPTLEAATLERTRAQFLARASLEAGDANKVANAQWMAQSFAGHAYSRAIAGTPDSIRAVTREDLDAYRKRIMAKRTLRVAAVGDIDAATLGQVLDEVFGALPAEPQLDAHPRCGPQGGAEAQRGEARWTAVGRHLRPPRRCAQRSRLLRRPRRHPDPGRRQLGGAPGAGGAREARARLLGLRADVQLQACLGADRRRGEPQRAGRPEPRPHPRPVQGRWRSAAPRRRRSTRPRAT